MKSIIPQDMHDRTMSNLIVVCTGLLFYAVLMYFGKIMGFLSSILDAAMPFVIGIGIAFLLLPIVKRVEWFFSRVLFRRKPHPKLSRTLATVIGTLVLLAFITGFIAVLVPQLYRSVKSIVLIITRWISQNSYRIEQFLLNLEFLSIEGEQLVVAWENVTSQMMNMTSQLTNLLNASSTLMGGLLAMTNGIYSTVFQLFVGMIASFYLMMDKEIFCAQAKKLCYALLSRSACETLIFWTRRANKIFAGFISGKILDSLIIAIICYVFMLIARIEYALLISVIIGVTNIIPFFGPFIGAVPSILLLLLIDPIHALIFAVFIVVLQQLDGNVIGPFILGDYVGLSPFWIMLSIVVGGALFGFIGMLLGIPVFALFYAIVRTAIDLRLKKQSLPTEVEYYQTMPERAQKGGKRD